MKKTILQFCLGFVSLGSALAYSGDNNTAGHTTTLQIPAVALIDLESTGSVDFTMRFQAPIEAGLPITKPGSSSAIYLNYSSILPASGASSRQITAQITSGSVPSGTVLTVAATPPLAFPGITGGQLGGAASPNPIPIRSTNADPIITAIGSSYTGNGSFRGHILVFDIDLSSGGYSALRSGEVTVGITYTIQDVN